MKGKLKGKRYRWNPPESHLDTVDRLKNEPILSDFNQIINLIQFSKVSNKQTNMTKEGFICTFSLLISLSFTFQSSKFYYSSSSKCCLTRTGNSNESVQLSFHYLKRDKTRRCFLFSVTCHIRIFSTGCEMIHELIICNKLLK